MYGSSIDSWWCCDDPQILKHAITLSPLEYFTVPEAWRALIPYSLTPWLTLTYDVDHALFGFDPRGYYAHNLIALTGCGWLLYKIARHWVSAVSAWSAAMLFLAAPPVAAASQQLMIRHYVEGLLFYLLALWLFVRSVDERKSHLGFLAGFAFLIAATAKELYLPLGLIPFLLPVASLRRRLFHGWPFLFVMVLYVPWRRYMLGEILGGYVPAAGLMEEGILRLAWTQFTQVPALLSNHPTVAITVCSIIIVWGIADRSIQARATALMAALPILLLTPLIPLVRYPGLGAGSERYFLAAWATLSLTIAILAGLAFDRARDGRRWLLPVLVAALFLTVWQASQKMVAGLIASKTGYQAQGNALVMARAPDLVLVSPGIPTWFNSGVMDLRPAMGQRSPPPMLVADESEFAGLDLAGRQMLRFDPATQSMVDIAPQMPALVETWKSRLQARPLQVTMTYDRQKKVLSWNLGPNTDGQFRYLDAGGSTPVPATGALRMDKPPDGCFRFRHDAPDGRTAYTPALSLPAVADGQTSASVTWQGQWDLLKHLADPDCNPTKNTAR